MSGTLNQVMMAIGSVRRAWYMLCGIAAMSLGLGYAYLLFMKIFAKPLVYGSLVVLVIALLGSGAYMIYTAPIASVPAAAVIQSGNATEGAIAETAATGGMTENEVVRQNLFAGVAGEYAQ